MQDTVEFEDKVEQRCVLFVSSLLYFLLRMSQNSSLGAKSDITIITGIVWPSPFFHLFSGHFENSKV